MKHAKHHPEGARPACYLIEAPGEPPCRHEGSGTLDQCLRAFFRLMKQLALDRRAATGTLYVQGRERVTIAIHVEEAAGG